MNNDHLIKTIIADLLDFAVPIKFDEVSGSTGFGIEFLDREEREYATGVLDTLIGLVDVVRGDLSTKVFKFAETLAKEILERHPSWKDLEFGDLEAEDPWQQSINEDMDRDAIVDDFWLDIVSGN